MNTDLSADKKQTLRLNRFLAQCGLGSRRSCEQMIKAGRIYVNGKKIVELGTAIDVQYDEVHYKGKKLNAIRPLEYFAYNKPRCVIVSSVDPQGRETIYEAIKKSNGVSLDHLRYVGRLDYDSEGLLLLTNDGDTIHGLTHPRYHIKKVYQVKISRRVAPHDLAKLTTEGILSEGQLLHAGKIQELPISQSGEPVWYEVVLYEGRNRQIRRMFEALSYDVAKLKRVQYGPVKLGTLSAGRARALDDKEIEALKRIGYAVHSGN